MTASTSKRTPPWITAEGCFDPAAYPLEESLGKALEPSNDAEFRTACSLLGQRAAHGKSDATVALLGLLSWYREDLGRLDTIVESLRNAPSEITANALFAELRRVKSSNSTRRYIKSVLQTLARYPCDLVENGFANLANDPSFSYRMRSKFRALAEGYNPF